jgi:hypothetical protein
MALSIDDVVSDEDDDDNEAEDANDDVFEDEVEGEVEVEVEDESDDGEGAPGKPTLEEKQLARKKKRMGEMFRVLRDFYVAYDRAKDLKVWLKVSLSEPTSTSGADLLSAIRKAPKHDDFVVETDGVTVLVPRLIAAQQLRKLVVHTLGSKPLTDTTWHITLREETSQGAHVPASPKAPMVLLHGEWPRPPARPPARPRARNAAASLARRARVELPSAKARGRPEVERAPPPARHLVRVGRRLGVRAHARAAAAGVGHHAQSAEHLLHVEDGGWPDDAAQPRRGRQARPPARPHASPAHPARHVIRAVRRCTCGWCQARKLADEQAAASKGAARGGRARAMSGGAEPDVGMVPGAGFTAEEVARADTAVAGSAKARAKASRAIGGAFLPHLQHRFVAGSSSEEAEAVEGLNTAMDAASAGKGSALRRETAGAFSDAYDAGANDGRPLGERQRDMDNSLAQQGPCQRRQAEAEEVMSSRPSAAPSGGGQPRSKPKQKRPHAMPAAAAARADVDPASPSARSAAPTAFSSPGVREAFGSRGTGAPRQAEADHRADPDFW